MLAHYAHIVELLHHIKGCLVMLVEASRGLTRLICNGSLCHLRFHCASLGGIGATVTWRPVENPGALIQTLRVFGAACHAFHCV